jgi:hypothetical protein
LKAVLIRSKAQSGIAELVLSAFFLACYANFWRRQNLPGQIGLFKKILLALHRVLALSVGMQQNIS